MNIYRFLWVTYIPPPPCHRLLATGNAYLVEVVNYIYSIIYFFSDPIPFVQHTKKDSYWGDGPDGKGRNQLGLTLIAVRNELRAADQARLTPAANPAAAADFLAGQQTYTPVVYTKEVDMLPHHPREDALKAEFIEHVTLSDGRSVLSGRPIVKIWRVRNNGLTTWPNDTEVVFIEGMPGGKTSFRVPALQPNEEGEVMCTLQPAADAISKSTWRLRSASVQNGKDGFFGPFLESNIIIGDTNDEDSLQSDNDDSLEAPSVIASSPKQPSVIHAPVQLPPQPYYPTLFISPENSLANPLTMKPAASLSDELPVSKLFSKGTFSGPPVYSSTGSKVEFISKTPALIHSPKFPPASPISTTTEHVKYPVEAPTSFKKYITDPPPPVSLKIVPAAPSTVAKNFPMPTPGGVGPAPAKNIGLDRRSPTPEITFSREATPDPTPVTKKQANLVPAADLDWERVCTKSDLQGLIYLFSTF